jgi:hypothetical protein
VKKLVLSTAVLVLLLTSFASFAVNADWVCLADNRYVLLDDDPNEPQPEGTTIGQLIGSIDDDPNEPQPEGTTIGQLIDSIDDDPNEPQPESTATELLISSIDEDPNEPQPENT